MAAQAQPDAEWLDVAELFRIVRRRFMTGLVVFVAFVALAAIPILDMKRSYTAQARVLMRDPPSVGLLAPDASQKPLNLSTEIERFLSRDISARVIREVGLDKLPEFNVTLREVSLPRKAVRAVKRLFSGAPPTPAPEADDLRLVMPAYMARLTVFQKGNADVVNIGFSSEDAAIAAAVPNAVVRIYLETRERQRRSELTVDASWLKARIEEQKTRLAEALEAVAARRNQPDRWSPNALGVDAAIASLTERRIGLRHQLAAAQRQLDELKLDGAAALGPSAAAGEEPGAPPTASLTFRLRKAEAELATLLHEFGENHAKIREARQRIADIESQMDLAVAARTEDLTRKVAALQAEQLTTLAELERARDTLAREKEAETELAQLERQAEKEQELLTSLDQQLRAVLSTTGRPFTEVSVLAPASVPLLADGRGKAFYFAVAMIGGLLAALTAIFGREILDTTVRSSEHLRRIRRVFPAGIIPTLPAPASPASGLMGWWEPDGAFADAVRGVLIAISHTTGHPTPRSLLVTSALPGEGKTTVAAALAAELAGAGERVLLVDADLRRGDLHRRFGQEDGPGLADYLAGTRALAEVIRRNVAPSIDLLSCGTRASGGRLDRQKIAALLQMASDAGQTVIIDTPPALATVDTVSLGDLVDNLLLVVEWGRTGAECVEAAVQRLALGGGSDVFVAINQVSPRRQTLFGLRDGGALAHRLGIAG